MAACSWNARSKNCAIAPEPAPAPRQGAVARAAGAGRPSHPRPTAPPPISINPHPRSAIARRGATPGAIGCGTPVGRPTPRSFAERLTRERDGAKIRLKRENRTTPARAKNSSSGSSRRPERRRLSLPSPTPSPDLAPGSLPSPPAPRPRAIVDSLSCPRPEARENAQSLLSEERGSAPARRSILRPRLPFPHPATLSGPAPFPSPANRPSLPR